MRNYNLSSRIFETAKKMPNNLAIWSVTSEIDYLEFAMRASATAQTLCSFKRPRTVGILASRSVEACVGVVGAAWAGATYVPLSLKAPDDLLVAQLNMLDLDALIVDEGGIERLSQTVLHAAPRRIVFPAFKAPVPDVCLRLSPNLDAAETLEPPVPIDRTHTAYIEFTSGTTGTPKGVMISAGAVANYVDVLQQWYGFRKDDRAAETCDMTFDLSVHNMMLAWSAGACLYQMRPIDLVAPTRFIQKHGITTWLSVPSLAAIALKMGMLTEGALPSLRISLFCGEPLPVAVADQWAVAAPNSTVDNIYGPTEATIACTRQTWTTEPSATAERGVVAIGQPFPGMKVAVLNNRLDPLLDCTPGEIALSGVQLAQGYLDQTELTRERFPVVAGERWYLTGDLGRLDSEDRLHHLGRIDNQIKVRGHRVELEEVEHHLRVAAGTQFVAAIAQNVSHGSAENIIGFCVQATTPQNEILPKMRNLVPEHMVPERIEFLEELPLNSNGKLDRPALTAWLQSNGGLE